MNMTVRDRFNAVMNFQPFDRLPIMEWASWWDKTIERWHGEGLPAATSDPISLADHFGLDLHLQDWVGVRGPGCPHAIWHGAPLITNEAEYLALRPHLFPRPAIDERRWNQWADRQAAGGAILWFTLEGYFWFPRTLLGIEGHLYAFYDQPDLMHHINADLAEWSIEVIEQITRICTPDFMTFGEDMSYNHGPMLSAELFEQFIAPYYRRVTPHLHRCGVLPIVDSDGDITTAAPWFESVGLKGVLPLERQAGVDIAALRRTHPDMRFIGHFDKMTMTRGEAVMRREFERLVPTAGQGGFIISCDHQTPPGVSYNEYLLYLKLFAEYAEQAGRISRDTRA